MHQIGKADHAWVSPSTQTRETAAILGLTATEDTRLRDCDYGRWTGLTFKSVLLREPRKLVSWVRNPASAPHGGETIPEVITRIAGWLNERKRDQGHTVVVSHSAVIRAAIVSVIEAEPKSFWRIDIEPLARADLRTNGRRWVLRALHPGRTTDAGQ